jgi:FkbM family methyltransferase
MLQKVPYLDGFVYIDPEENIGQHVFSSGVYEPNLIHIVTKCVEAGFNFVDVGANIGLHTLAAGFSSKHLNQTVTAFEPEPEIYRQLAHNCAENQLDVILYQIGLSNQMGELTLYQSTDHNAGAHSFIHRANTAPAGTVPVKTLDTVFENSDATLPTLIKIDVEGFESQVLQGGRGWLQGLQDAVMLIEITPHPTETADASDINQPSLIDQINAAGFLHHIVINDFDTFDEYGHLRNDYFNIACWKGEQADKVMTHLIPELAIQQVPYNAADFVDWERYSTVKLHPGQTRTQIGQSKQFAELATKVEQLEGKLNLTEFDFTPSLIGKIRKTVYGIGAKWGVRYLAHQQEKINRELLDLLKIQQAELEQLRQIVNNEV